MTMQRNIAVYRRNYLTPMKHRKHSRGFLLLDALISLSLLGLIGGMGIAALNSAYDGEAFMQTQRESLADLQRAVGFIERDLAQLTARPIRDEFGDKQAALIINETNDFPLEFTRAGWPNPAEQQRSTLQRVAYIVDDNSLYRLYWPQLDRAQGAQPISALLLTGVTELSATAWQAAEASTDIASNTSQQDDARNQMWPPNNIGANANNLYALPQAVEITIEIEAFGTLKRLIVVAP